MGVGTRFLWIWLPVGGCEGCAPFLSASGAKGHTYFLMVRFLNARFQLYADVGVDAAQRQAATTGLKELLRARHRE